DVLQQRDQVAEVGVARLLYGRAGTAHHRREARPYLVVARVRPEEQLETQVGIAFRPQVHETLDHVSFVGLVRGRVPGVEDDGLGGIEAEPCEQRLVLGPRAAAMVDVALRPARDRDPRRGDPVVAQQVVSHRLALYHVAREVWRDHALADGVIPARDVADDRQAAPSSGRRGG